MKRTIGLVMFAAVAVTALGSCNSGPNVTRTDTETSGFAVIAADESFAPIVNEQLAVFTGLNPEAGIDPLFVSENELFDLLLSDSVRLIITTRDLTQTQRDSLRKMKLTPRSQRLAGDGVALIINRSNPDSLISVPEFRKVLSGEITDWNQIDPARRSKLGKIQVVFDKPNSSTLRFVHDSIMQGAPLSPDLRALNGNPAVIEYVAQTPNSLGIIGVNWISNPNDTTQMRFNEEIRVVAVSRETPATRDNAFRPYPAYLNNGSYPFRRDLFIIISDSFGGLPSGFVKFAAGDAGQRIILNAGLVPGTRPTREIMIRDDF